MMLKEIANDLKQNLEKINHHGKRAGDIVKKVCCSTVPQQHRGKEPTINALCDEYLRLAYHGLRAKDKSFTRSLKPILMHHFQNKCGTTGYGERI